MTHRAVILAVDPGARAGWRVRSPERVGYGVAETHAQRCEAVLMAKTEALRLGLPLVIIAEAWTRFGKWGAAQMAGTAAQWGRWQVAIDETHLETMPKIGRAKAYCGVVRVQSDVWYRALIAGPGRCTTKRPQRLLNAQARAGIADPDIAVATCIAEWATLSPLVGKRLPVAFRTVAARGQTRRARPPTRRSTPAYAPLVDARRSKQGGIP